MKRAALPLSALAVLLSLVTAPQAALKKWAIEPSVHEAYYYIDKDAQLHHPTYGMGRIGFNVFPAFEVEATFESISTDSKEERFKNSDWQSDFSGLRFLGTFRATEDEKVYPYIVAGLGKVKTTFDSGIAGDPELKDNAVYDEIGFGARVFVWKQLNIRPEFSLHHYRTLGQTQTNARYSVGISYFFLGSKK